MKYATFDSTTGILNGRYDTDINEIIPDSAVEISDDIFWMTINEIDGQWKLVNESVIKVPFPAPSAARMISTAQARINAAYQAAVDVMTAGYPEDEIKSWPKQEQEARAWLASPSEAVTPWIDAAAAARGITKGDLVAKIIDNANIFTVAHGALTGKRQALRDQIDALGNDPTQEQLDAIQW